MWKHNQEAIEAVEKFNEKVEEVLGNERWFSADWSMTMETNGTQSLIRFMGVVLWNSEDDERESEDEPLLRFLERKFKQHLEFFSLLLPETEVVEQESFQEGDFVHYKVPHKVIENGRIKSIGHHSAFVVNNCNDDWNRYKDYTGQATKLSELHPGWVDKNGNPIDTPKTEDSENT